MSGGCWGGFSAVKAAGTLEPGCLISRRSNQVGGRGLGIDPIRRTDGASLEMAVFGDHRGIVQSLIFEARGEGVELLLLRGANQGFGLSIAITVEIRNQRSPT